MTQPDRVFEGSIQRVGDFKFNDAVANVFDDMVNRSVPFYQEVERMTVEMVAECLHLGGQVYDVGSSTGTTLQLLLDVLDPMSSVGLVGIEPADAMRNKAVDKLRAHPLFSRITLVDSPIEDFETLDDACAVIMLFTLQFVRPMMRQQVVKMIHKSLKQGGCLVLGEKILSDESLLSRAFVEYYHLFKKRSGYSVQEIARKREALENVLVPFRNSENITMLHDAGFRVVDTAFRWYNFALYIAFKA